jgi:pimeloyl-ACP methyl ester carboxylesterase
MNRKDFETARRFADTSFGRIAYVEKGDGPAAVFCHAAVLNGYQWRDVLDHCSGARRVIAFDNLGHGHTEAHNDVAVDFAAHARMLDELLDELDIDQIDLVGNDSGGAIAQTFAVSWPERVRTLALANCDARDSAPPPSLLPLIDLARAGAVAEMWGALIQDADLARSPEGLGALYEHPEGLSDDTLDVYLSPPVADEATARTLERFLISLSEDQLADIEPALHHLEVPTLIAWGTADPTFELDRAHWLADTIPAARPVVEVEGGKLLWPEEHPQLLGDLLLHHWTAA